MTDKTFRKELDLLIEQNLNELIKETKDYDYAISKASDKSKAQIWVALAILNNKINQIHTKSNPIKKIPQNEMNKILKTLESL